MSSKGTQNWRVKTKKRIITAFGGKCCICNYKKSRRALHLHHLDPNEKDFSLGSVRAWPSAWNRVVKELRKCVMVCSNCHGEIHDGLTEVPQDAVRFDEAYADYKEMERLERRGEIEKPCLNCGKLFYEERAEYCSPECYNIKSRKCVHPSKEELIAMLEVKTISTIAREYNVSWNAVKKWCNKHQI